MDRPPHVRAAIAAGKRPAVGDPEGAHRRVFSAYQRGEGPFAIARFAPPSDGGTVADYYVRLSVLAKEAGRGDPGVERELRSASLEADDIATAKEYARRMIELRWIDNGVGAMDLGAA